MKAEGSTTGAGGRLTSPEPIEVALAGASQPQAGAGAAQVGAGAAQPQPAAFPQPLPQPLSQQEDLWQANSRSNRLPPQH